MLDPLRVAVVGEAAHHTLQQTNLPIRLAQQQRPAVGRQPAAIKPPYHLPRKMCFKGDLGLVTLK